MDSPLPTSPAPRAATPPIGGAPENQDFKRPWLISAIVSTLCFGAGFFLLYTTGIWTRLRNWADWPFMFYLAILTPVLLGFYAYGVYRVIEIVRQRKSSSPSGTPRP
jgi:hypothetical protein